MRPITFWLSSLLTALTVAGAAATIFPYGALGLESEVDRQRALLVTLWTSGVMAICFGATGLLTFFVPVGFRDVHDAGSVTAAMEARLELRERQSGTAFYNFAGWTVSTGVFLILLYFVAWVATGR